MKEIATIMTDEEFEKYLDNHESILSEMYAKKMGTALNMCCLAGMVSATAGMDRELVFTATQLKKIFDLAEEKNTQISRQALGAQENLIIIIINPKEVKSKNGRNTIRDH